MSYKRDGLFPVRKRVICLLLVLSVHVAAANSNGAEYLIDTSDFEAAGVELASSVDAAAVLPEAVEPGKGDAGIAGAVGTGPDSAGAAGAGFDGTGFAGGVFGTAGLTGVGVDAAGFAGVGIDVEGLENGGLEAAGHEVVEIVISAAGDCTFGGDLRSGPNGFMREFYRQGGDYSYFLRGVSHIFEADDLTIVNMEGTFTDSGNHLDKTFVLSGPEDLVEVFTLGGVDVVTVANNHSRDYLSAGYENTVSVLNDAGIMVFGDDIVSVFEVKGIYIGMFGYTLWGSDRAVKARIADAIGQLRGYGADIVIAYYHWGLERVYYPMAYQVEIARHTIDSGADLVLGSHPHVLQGIEEYAGKNIVYSLGNFCFGANMNPDDKDSMIFQQTFVFADGVLSGSRVNIIPCSISSVGNRNDYQPTVLEGADAERVLAKIDMLSRALASPGGVDALVMDGPDGAGPEVPE